MATSNSTGRAKSRLATSKEKISASKQQGITPYRPKRLPSKAIRRGLAIYEFEMDYGIPFFDAEMELLEALPDWILFCNVHVMNMAETRASKSKRKQEKMALFYASLLAARMFRAGFFAAQVDHLPQS